MTSIVGRVCAAYRLLAARALGPASCGLEMPGLLKLTLAFSDSCSTFIDLGRQPAHSSHSVSRSVERAVGASHGTTGGACKAVGEEADLVRLESRRRSKHRRSSEEGPIDDFKLCAKGLIGYGFAVHRRSDCLW